MGLDVTRTITDQMRDAVRDDNAHAVGRLHDYFRGEGLSYSATWRVFNNVTGIAPAEYDALILEFEK